MKGNKNDAMEIVRATCNTGTHEPTGMAGNVVATNTVGALKAFDPLKPMNTADMQKAAELTSAIDYSDTDIHFAGGVLMTLLADAEVISRNPVRVFGETVNLNEGNLFLFMIKLIRPMHTPSNFNTLRKQSIQYKHGEISIRSDIPFHEEGYIRLFKERMGNDYYRLMGDAFEVLNSFLRISDEDTKNTVADKIVRSIMEVISLDDAIPEKALFPIQPDGSAITKVELVNCTRINFYSFIVGVFYYACTKITDNTLCADTVKLWTVPQEGKGKKALMHEGIGNTITQNLDISFALPVMQNSEDESVPYAPILKENQIATLSTYLEPLYESKYRVPTLMYGDTLTPLYDFYVPPVLRIRETDILNKRSPYITKPTPEKLKDYASQILIVGDGGMGKSTVVLDLLLQCIRNFPSTGVLPIFVELKEFRSSYTSMEQFLYEKTEAWWDHSFRAFTIHLERYQTVIFLDGFDEIKSCYRKYFANLLNDFSCRYTKAQIIASSRLVSHVVPMLRFRSVSIQPFTIDQCAELINKYDYRPERPEYKAAFIKALRDDESGVYRRHQQLAENPLLCTMMFRIYARDGRIPTNIARFYEQAYQILAAEHDATKVYERQLYTGLEPRGLKVILEEVCMYAYADEQYFFTVDEMSKYLSWLNSYAELGIKPINAEDLLADLKDNLCLMTQHDDGRYSFVGNRYFDNYFAAVYMSLHLEGNSEYAIEVFEKGRRYNCEGDHMLEMLYHLGRKTTQIHLFLPKLERVISKIESMWKRHIELKERNAIPVNSWDDDPLFDDKDRFCCFAYLKECYDTISYTTGTVLYEATNYPISPLLNFILELNNFHSEEGTELFDNPDDYFTDDVFYEYRADPESETEIVTAQDLKRMETTTHPLMYDGEIVFDPEEDEYTLEEIGRFYIIQMDELDYRSCPALVESITDDYSPYFREYKSLLDYYEELKQIQMETTGNVFRRPTISRTA